MTDEELAALLDAIEQKLEEILRLVDRRTSAEFRQFVDP